MRISRVLLLLTVLAVAATVSMADQSIFLCNEDPVTGCVMQLPVGGTTMWIASDGEASFDPWGYGHDTSDGVALDSIWQFNSGASWVFCPWCAVPGVPGLNIWIQPACVGLVCENGNVPESVIYFDAPGYTWNFNGTIYFTIWDSQNEQSDYAAIGNFGPNGDAGFAFSSTPEPGTLLLLGSGLMGAVSYARRRFLK